MTWLLSEAVALPSASIALSKLFAAGRILKIQRWHDFRLNFLLLDASDGSALTPPKSDSSPTRARLPFQVIMKVTRVSCLRVAAFLRPSGFFFPGGFASSSEERLSSVRPEHPLVSSSLRTFVSFCML